MREAYSFARKEISSSHDSTERFLDCGCGSGHEITNISRILDRAPANFTGIEWNDRWLEVARSNGYTVLKGDLNKKIPVDSESQDCAYALSLLEHLLMPCAFLKECHRVLRPGGRLVLLTPNISTYFTAALILAGRMPSSGPHPDSNALIASQEVIHVSRVGGADLEDESPAHRHLVVFSFLALRKFLRLAGFEIEKARGFGLYPLPNFLQPVFERLDPYHCHQMVFVCRKPRRLESPLMSEAIASPRPQENLHS
jgi:2-polyprenyl-3-methyl-5-hydroxy-6-metoxy-1,4-benzoquinol methylase